MNLLRRCWDWLFAVDPPSNQFRYPECFGEALSLSAQDVAECDCDHCLSAHACERQAKRTKSD